MLMFKKKKIQSYLSNLGDNKTAFDLLLCDYLDGSLKKELETLGLAKIDIHVDFYEDIKCIGVQCKYQKYYVDIQIYPDEFSVSYAVDEPDENTVYPLESKEQVYKTLSHAVQTMEKND